MVAKHPDFITVKVPVFSFDKLSDVEPALGPEMKSTGEVIGIAPTFEEALYKGLIASGIKLPEYGRVLLTISDRYKEEVLSIAKEFNRLGFKLVATEGTAQFIQKNLDFEIETVKKIGQHNQSLLDLIKEKKVDLVINTLSKDKKSNTDGFKMRRFAEENKIPCFTSLDTVMAVLKIYQHRSLSIKGFS